MTITAGAINLRLLSSTVEAHIETRKACDLGLVDGCTDCPDVLLVCDQDPDAPGPVFLLPTEQVDAAHFEALRDALDHSMANTVMVVGLYPAPKFSDPMVQLMNAGPAH